jgi:hypothetical protein
MIQRTPIVNLSTYPVMSNDYVEVVHCLTTPFALFFSGILVELVSTLPMGSVNVRTNVRTFTTPTPLPH